MIKTAEILCVGTELLLGEVINTNAVHISKKLAEFGVSVISVTLLVLNALKSKLVNPEHSENMSDIFVTFEVLKFDKSKLVNPEHPENMRVTLDT